MNPVGFEPWYPEELYGGCCCCCCCGCCDQPVEYCRAEGAGGEEGEDTAFMFGNRAATLAVWSMNGLFEKSAMDGVKRVISS